MVLVVVVVGILCHGNDNYDNGKNDAETAACNGPHGVAASLGTVGAGRCDVSSVQTATRLKIDR